MPSPSAAAGAAFSRGKLYVMGGVGPSGLARSALEYDPASRRWRTIPGPTPREHLAVTAARGRIFVVAGRTAGFDTNLDVVQAYSPATRRWTTLPPVPGRRGGTSATSTGRYVVSVGGEANEGTIKEVYALDLNTNRWRRLADLPDATPRPRSRLCERPRLRACGRPDAGALGQSGERVPAVALSGGSPLATRRLPPAS